MSTRIDLVTVQPCHGAYFITYVGPGWDNATADETMTCAAGLDRAKRVARSLAEAFDEHGTRWEQREYGLVLTAPATREHVEDGWA